MVGPKKAPLFYNLPSLYFNFITILLLDLKTLFTKYNLAFSGVVHVGANVGEERHLYKKLGILRQVWFEPNKDIFPILEKNLAPNKQAKAYNVGLGSESFMGVLKIASNGGQSSSFLSPSGHLDRHPDVTFDEMQYAQVERLDDILSTDRINVTDWLLTLDTQGFEIEVLKGAEYSLAKFKAIYTEVSIEELYLGAPLLGSLDAYLEARGFIGVATKMTGRAWGESLYIRVEDFESSYLN